MLNSATAKNEARQPRAIVKLNGDEVRYLSCQINNTGFYQADTFSIVFAISEQRPGFDVNFFSKQAAILVEIYIGFPANPSQYNSSQLQLFIVGQSDELIVDIENQTITLIGRDLTAKFIDNKTTNKYPNLTASQIAVTLAEEHGLTPVVTPTTERVGTFYQNEMVRLTDESSQWDLLSFLANQQGFVVYVKGYELHFEPPPSINDNPYVISYTPPSSDDNIHKANVVSLKVIRSLTLAKDIEVKVRTFNAETGKAVTKKARATHAKRTTVNAKAARIGNVQTYSFTAFQLTPEQALQLAQRKLRELTKHELRLEAVLAGDNILTTRNIIKVTGTQSNFDDIYFPDSVIRRLSDSTGYQMEVMAKNHPVDSEVLI